MYQISLKNFEGPLDLLLFFIKRDEIDIYDIPIAKITEEYLNALDQIHQLNLSVAGEFVEMAAMLMRIKAKMLLPVTGGEDDEIEDPRTELVRRLLEYQQYKKAVQELEQYQDIRSQKFPRSFQYILDTDEENAGAFLKDTSLFDLAAYFKDVMERMPLFSTYELSRPPIGLEDQKRFILKGFNTKGILRLSTIIKKLTGKIEAIVTFLAILELVKLAQVRLKQGGLFKDLELHLIEPEILQES